MLRGDIAPVIDPDQVDDFIAQGDWCALLAEHVNTVASKQLGDGVFDLRVGLVIPHASEYAVRSSEPSQRTNHLNVILGVPSDVVPRQRDQIGFQGISNADTTADVVRVSKGADVNVGK